MVGCLVLQVLESTVTPELEGFFSVCVFADRVVQLAEYAES